MRENQAEYRLVTNLPRTGEGAISDEEGMEIYRCRWGIDLLWKFLKMHLKLDHLITKNPNGITIQIYAIPDSLFDFTASRNSSIMRI
jgi:putative transposase